MGKMHNTKEIGADTHSVSLTTVIYFTARDTNMYHILMKGQIMRLSNKILDMRVGERGDVKIHWLQPSYSAFSCSQITKEKVYIALKVTQHAA